MHWDGGGASDSQKSGIVAVHGSACVQVDDANVCGKWALLLHFPVVIRWTRSGTHRIWHSLLMMVRVHNNIFVCNIIDWFASHCDQRMQMFQRSAVVPGARAPELSSLN